MASGAAIGPLGPPAKASAEWYTSGLWNPDSRVPVAEADTLFLMNVQTEAEVLAQGGRLSDVYDTYLASATVKAPLTTGPYTGKAAGQSAGTTDHIVFPLDGILPTDEFTIEFKLKPKGADLAAIAGAKVFLQFGSGTGTQPDQLKILAQSGVALRAQMTVDGLNYYADDLIITVGDHPADTWKTYSVVLDSTTLTMRLGNATKTSSGNTHGANPAPARQARPYSSVDYAGGGIVINGGMGVASSAVEIADVKVSRWARTPNAQRVYKGPTVVVDPATPVAGSAPVTDVTGVFAQYPGWRDGANADGSLGGGGLTATSIRDQLITAQTGSGMKVVRIDHVFDKITIVDNGGGATPRYTYNWANLDEAMDKFHAAGCDFHVTLGFCPRPLNGGAGTAYNTPPSDNTLFAQMCSDALAHFVTAKGYRLRTISLWNEPDVSTTFWTGTSAQYNAMWAAVRTRLAADWPAYPLGGPDTNWSTTGYTKLLLDYCATNSITFAGPLLHHDYSGSLWQLRYDIDKMKAYAVTKGFSASLPVIVSEWSCNQGMITQYIGLNTSLQATREPTNNEKFAAYCFAFVAEMMAAGVSLATFTRMGILDTYFGGVEQFYGLFSNQDPPRPLPAFAAFQALWKLQGTRTTATSNWPSVRALSSKTAAGVITTVVGTYRPWNEGDTIGVSLEHSGLPTNYTWKLYRWDKRNKGDNRLLQIAGGDQTNLPQGVNLHMFGIACLQITPS